MGFVVAVDGPGGAGKGTICGIASKILGFSYLDTGLLYRAVANKLLSENSDTIISRAIEVSAMIQPDDLKHSQLKSSQISILASKIAVIPEVRERLLNFQIEFSKDPKGAILDGRDIGLKVCPDADIKFFVTAALDIRAKRRWADMAKLKNLESFDSVKADLMERDARDQNRVSSPLVKAEDALLIDTSELTIDASVKLFIDAVNEKLNN